MLITSRSNPRIKAIRGLSLRKNRQQSGRFYIEGLHLLAAAVRAGAAIETLVFCPPLLTSQFGHELIQPLLDDRRIEHLEVSADVFRDALAAKDITQGVGAVLRERYGTLDDLTRAPSRWWIALDTVNYPGNLGTILRTADAAGCGGAILVGTTTDPHDPAAVRASRGAVFALPLARATLQELAAWKRTIGCTIIGTSPTATADYRSAPYKTPFIILMGSESGGLGQHMDVCDLTVRIPMVGTVDSLNLAVSAGIMIYEAFHHQPGRQDVVESAPSSGQP